MIFVPFFFWKPQNLIELKASNDLLCKSKNCLLYASCNGTPSHTVSPHFRVRIKSHEDLWTEFLLSGERGEVPPLPWSGSVMRWPWFNAWVKVRAASSFSLSHVHTLVLCSGIVLSVESSCSPFLLRGSGSYVKWYQVQGGGGFLFEQGDDRFKLAYIEVDFSLTKGITTALNYYMIRFISEKLN